MTARWQRISETHPKGHARYVVRRGLYTFVATPCYGMHLPWWVPMTPTCELSPIAFAEDDEWIAIPEGGQP